MRAILDTSVLLSAEVPPIDADLSISVASLAELHVGVLVARDAGRRAERFRRLTLIERHFSALPIDDAVARSYGQLAAAVTAFGRQPRA
ncbi:MAG TPA: VapC toxin family PIN domain ribonuclease, partial [Actinomycetes bacterium]|nr:VapC toxin family PIN domain ribonuclease [Actinomycetes bacterium]